MLKEGTYPYVLKKRILSTKGHLDNMAAGWLVAGMTPLPQEIFLAHLSQENNSPETALEAVQAVLAKTGTTTKIKIYVTAQDRVIKNFTGEDYHEENIFA
jgi:phosphoribosyl 1,2-cyclic phosphodiesterase